MPKVVQREIETRSRVKPITKLPTLKNIALVDERELLDLMPMREAIETIDIAMRELSDGTVLSPERWAMRVGPQGALALMPGATPSSGHFGVKLLSLFENAGDNGLPGHQGMMVLFDQKTGAPLGIFEANALTGLRTAAASAVATRALSRPEASTLAILGYGEQAKWHAQALPLVRSIKEVRIWGRSREKAEAFAASRLQHIPHVVISGSARDAVVGADIVCTTTHSSEPVLSGEWLEPGQHLNLVGASTKNEREVDAEAVARSRFFVDSADHARAQAGELLDAINQSRVGLDHIQAEIGEVLLGLAAGRTDPADITVYKSLGHIVQDIAVARTVQARLADAKTRGLLANS